MNPGYATVHVNIQSTYWPAVYLNLETKITSQCLTSVVTNSYDTL